MFKENRSARAMIVLNMTNHFAHKAGKGYLRASEEIIPFVKGELQYFRERMRPIVFCNTLMSSEGEQEQENEFSNQVIKELSPRTGEPVIGAKNSFGFFQTNLKSILHDLKVQTLTIAGLLSHEAVLLTAASAIENGYSIVVPETCICSNREREHQAALQILTYWSKKWEKPND